MITRSLATLLCVLFVLTLPACAEDPAATLQGTVSRVYDGDTLEVVGLGKVRLLGIDAPEREDSSRDRYLQKQGVSAQKQREIYRAALSYNRKHVLDRQVRLALDRTERDKYGRLLAYVYLPDGQLLNRVLVEEGLAVVYRKFSFRLKDEFLAAEERARKTRKGLWVGL